ncbi:MULTISPECIES: leucine--tRNA ligase [unclassified Flavobacterium]|uniref:leucine--tRNA ligase n=1 Tax=unclassified Flavobacterium TaxID=196869 RepID=UPI0025B7E5A9|nr:MULTISPECIES: class I tRNA ligase family protein [unclassified Flavobacterium]
MKYNPNEIEAKWQKYWAENQTFAAQNNSEKPKYYVLDMFPYPSGAGLHVGHPLGYIASDVYSRYKRHRGFNVLHPMGYDSFGLPAEQYAIQTGQRPEDTTSVNIDGGVDKEGNIIAGYRKQLDKIGFSFDWSREVRTSNPDYYKHTQWIFIQLFNSWYNKNTDKASAISTLIALFEKEGNANVNAVCDDNINPFSSNEWNAFSSEDQQKILLQYRLTYLAETEVNWCPGLGTVLANDEIVNGVSERGGFAVIRKKMTQWSMRISAYAERLLQGLNEIDWSESIKESQRNWIGKSVGAMVSFNVIPSAVEETASIGELRNNPTEAEKMLWLNLKAEALDSEFVQQHLIDDYIVDFVCLPKKLIIEVDGGILYTTQQKTDAASTKVLAEKGFKVIRFNTKEILNNIDSVLNIIKHELHNAVVSPSESKGIAVFTTRPDTIFGVTFMTLAPEHPLVQEITTQECRENVEAYIEKTAKRSERERMADVKTISGVFTGAYAEHPFTKEPIPVWIGDYVLAGYGTGAVMAVPCGDERDYAFTNFFKGQNGMPEIKNIFANVDISAAAYGSKDNVVIANSDFLNGLTYKEATKKVISELEKINQGKGKINYRLRDAVFSRQRYWGEPFPVYYVNGLPQMIDAKHLPIVLPEVEKYLPTEDGLPPLGNALVWAWDSVNNKVVETNLVDNKTIFPLELNTMPGWAGSSWYWMRYMDAHNENEFAGKDALKYWESVDLYIGGSEHATGHLLYSRFWNKFLKDKGFAPTEEPFKKLINQGMILGMSAFVYRIDEIFINEFEIIEADKSGIKKGSIGKHVKDIKLNQSIFLSNNISDFKKYLKSKGIDDKEFPLDVVKDFNKIKNLAFKNSTKVEDEKYFEDDGKYVTSYVISPIHVDVSMVNSSDELDVEKFKNWREDYADAEFITEENGKYIVGREIEKMSKSKYNVVTPDDICNEYGADTLRLYEMFLGPLEQAKPWNTAGISGVFGFLKKLWRLYFDDNGLIVTNDEPTKDNLKSLHKTIKKVAEDIENFSFNTSVSQFMICVNELSTQNCHERAILEPLTILISSYAPHIAEELWSQLGNSGSISTVDFPILDEKHLVESSKEYPVSFNGKMRFTIELPLDLSKEQIEEIIMKDERTLKQLDGKIPNKIIIVPGKVINLVG